MKQINYITNQLIEVTPHDLDRLNIIKPYGLLNRVVKNISTRKCGNDSFIVGEVKMFSKTLKVTQTMGDSVWTIVHYEPLLISDVAKFNHEKFQKQLKKKEELKREEERIKKREEVIRIAKLCKTYPDEYQPKHNVKGHFTSTNCRKTASIFIDECVRQGIIVPEVEANPWLKARSFIDEYVKYKFVYVHKAGNEFQLIKSNIRPELAYFRF